MAICTALVSKVAPFQLESMGKAAFHLLLAVMSLLVKTSHCDWLRGIVNVSKYRKVGLRVYPS